MELRKRPAQIFDPAKDLRKYLSKICFKLIYARHLHMWRIVLSIISKISAAKQLFSDSGEYTENGKIFEMRADWILTNEKKVDVKLKILKDVKYLDVSI